MAATATLRMSREDALRMLRSLPATLAGKAADPTGLARGVMLLAAVQASSLVRQAFVVKSRGGTDEAGITWTPLDPKTVARRRSGLRKGQKRKKGTQPPPVEMLRDTGRLLASLTPTQDGPGPGGIVRVERGFVLVGTNVKYAAAQHYGTRHIPARPFWPEPGRWPERWKRAILARIREGVAAAVADLLRQAGAK